MREKVVSITKDWWKEKKQRSRPVHPGVSHFLREIIERPRFTVAENTPEQLKHWSGALHEFSMYVTPSCVYFLLQDDRVVYVGKSISLDARIQKHKGKRFNRVFVLAVKDRMRLERVERLFIRRLRPDYNIVGKQRT